jgi:hypothetical protein
MGAQLDEVKKDKRKLRRWLYFFAAAIGLVILGRDNSPTGVASGRGLGEQGVIAG